MSNFLPRSPSLIGRGKLAAKTRELEKAVKRSFVNGYGVTSGPLGTWVAYTKPSTAKSSSGPADTWA